MLKNITWTVLSRYGAQGLAVISNILLARYLGAEGFGEYALASAVLLIGNAFTNFGMDMILIRKLSVTDVPWLLTDGLGGQLFLSLVYSGAVFFVGQFVAIPFSVKFYTLALFPLSFYSIFTIGVRARQQMAMYSIAQLLMAVLQFFAVAVLWTTQGDLDFLILALLLTHVLIAIWANGHFAFRLEFLSMVRSFALLRESLSMAVIGTLRLVYEKLPLMLLPVIADFAGAGLFSAAARVTEAGKLGHLSAFTAMYPEMTRDDNFGKQQKGLAPLLGIGFSISVLLYFFAGFIIPFLFGAEFVLAVPVLRVLVWCIPPYVLVTYTSLGLVALGYEKPVLHCLLVALTVLLLLLVGLTIQFGSVGSALAVLFAEIVHAVLLWFQWRKYVTAKLP
jgi:O-antigen/teichoic acid export membrane protein